MVITCSVFLPRTRGWRPPLTSASLLLGAVLSGCQPDQPKEQSAQPHKSGSLSAVAAQPASNAPSFSLAPDTVERPVPKRPVTERYHTQATTRNYVGTVGGEPATVALTWIRPDSAVGRFYYWRRAVEYELTTGSRQRPGQLLLLLPGHVGIGQDSFRERVPGYWQVTSGPGPLLRGYWRDQAGRRRPFTLHESDRSSVRYAIENLSITESEPGAGDPRPWHESDFLHWLAGPAASRVLAWKLCPPRPRQRAIVLNNDYQAFCSSDIDVRLNDFHLLSYYRHDFVDPVEGQNDNMQAAWLFDLASGRELTIASQLLAGYELPLRRLLTQQLLHNPRYNYLDPELNQSAPATWRWTDEEGKQTALVSLPDRSEPLALTASGLEATYCPNTLFDAGGFAPCFPVVVPYADLRPLVRSGAPLARMLRARGLW